MPYQAMFLGWSRACGVSGIGLPRLEYLVHGDEHGMSHCHDGRAAADARNKAFEPGLKDGSVLHGCRPCTFRKCSS